MELQQIAFQLVAVVEVEGQVHVGSKEDEPGPTGKMLKLSTSTPLLKTLSRIESFMIAFNCLTLLKKDNDSYFVLWMVIFSREVSLSTPDCMFLYFVACLSSYHEKAINTLYKLA